MALDEKFILETYEDIYTGIMEHARQPVTDLNTLKKVKRFVNQRYSQVSAARKWKWRKTSRTLRLYHKLDGEMIIDKGRRSFSIEINFVDAGDTEIYNRKQMIPNFNGWKFYAAGMKEIYTIVSLTQSEYTVGDSISLQGAIDSPWLGETADGDPDRQAIVLFKDTYGLWPDFEEFDDIENRYKRRTISRVGPADLIYEANRNPRRIGDPALITVIGKAIFEGQRMDDFVMGSDFMGIPNGVKSARVYPAIHNEEKQIPIDYIKKVKPLIKSTDKPLMPPEDRICLYFGGLSDLYGVLKDQTEFENYENKFLSKVEQMTIDDQEDDDHPQFVPNVDYRSDVGDSQRIYRYDNYEHNED